MGDRKIPRAEDIFSGRAAGGIEPRSQLFKNKRAPAPPTGAALPKIGSYQPKSLAAVTPGGPVQEHVEPRHTNPVEQHKAPKHYVIGDKDTPLKIELIELDDQPVAPPRRKRKANDIDILEEDGDNVVSDNPLYGRQLSNMSNDNNTLDIPYTDKRGSVDVSNVSTTGSTIDPDYDEQGGVIDFGIDLDDEPLRYSSRNSSTQRKVEVDVHQNGDTDYPYIPPPDYDAEERTFSFEEENGKQVFKEYAGEDFGKYLDDDDDYRHNDRLRMRGVPRSMLKGKPSNKPRVQGKKYKKKHKQPELDKRNTIRDFTFTDTKIGWGDRTVKSTSAKGRYIKREKERQRIDTVEHLTRSKSQAGTYEDFLMAKHGEPESPNSSDSGVDTGEELINRRGAGHGEVNRGYHTDGRNDRPASDIHAFYHSQPKQMRESKGKDGHKEGLWKRLTWRFKKSINISSMEHR